MNLEERGREEEVQVRESDAEPTPSHEDWGSGSADEALIDDTLLDH